MNSHDLETAHELSRLHGELTDRLKKLETGLRESVYHKRVGKHDYRMCVPVLGVDVYGSRAATIAQTVAGYLRDDIASIRARLVLMGVDLVA